MTISTSTSKVIWQGNGATTVFSYSFPMPAASDAVLTFTDASGNQTVLSSGLYTITGVGIPTTGGQTQGGTVTYPLTGSPIAVGTSLTLLRVLPFTQETSLSNQGGLWPAVVEASDDNLEMQTQQLSEQLSRALLFNPADQGPFPPLPVASQRAGQALIFDSAGNPIVGGLAPGSVPVSTAMKPLLSSTTVEDGFNLLAVNGGTIGGDLVIDDSVSAQSGTIAGDFVIDGNLQNSGTASFNGTVTFTDSTNAIIVDGPATLNSAVHFGQTLAQFGTPFDVDTSGNVTCLSLTQTSDMGLKIDDGPLSRDEASEIIAGLIPRRFRWKSNPDDAPRLGFFAQEVQAIMPGAVRGDKVLGISETFIVAALVGAVKSLLERVRKLEGCD